jgi:hypothetical protein
MEAIWTCTACGEEIVKLFASYELSKWIHDRVRHPGLADALAYAGTIAIGLIVANGSGSKPVRRGRSKRK